MSSKSPFAHKNPKKQLFLDQELCKLEIQTYPRIEKIIQKEINKNQKLVPILDPKIENETSPQQEKEEDTAMEEEIVGENENSAKENEIGNKKEKGNKQKNPRNINSLFLKSCVARYNQFKNKSNALGQNYQITKNNNDDKNDNNNKIYFNKNNSNNNQNDNNKNNKNNNNNNNNNSNNNNNDNKNETKKKSKFDSRFFGSVASYECLDKIKPGLILNVYINCFSFNDENCCQSYDLQYKSLFESIIQGRINTDLYNTIKENECKFFDGYLVLEIHDYRHRMSSLLAKPDNKSQTGKQNKTVNKMSEKKSITNHIYQQNQQTQQQQQQQQQQNFQQKQFQQQRQQQQQQQQQQRRRRQQQQQINDQNFFYQKQQLQEKKENNSSMNESDLEEQRKQQLLEGLMFNPITDKKRKILLLLDQETFFTEISELEKLENFEETKKNEAQYQNYDIPHSLQIRNSRNRMRSSSSYSHPFDFNSNNFDNNNNNINNNNNNNNINNNKNNKWGFEKKSKLEYKLLLLGKIPTCFDKSIDALKISNFYFCNKYNTNYLREKIHEINNLFHHPTKTNKKKINLKYLKSLNKKLEKNNKTKLRKNKFRHINNNYNFHNIFKKNYNNHNNIMNIQKVKKKKPKKKKKKYSSKNTRKYNNRNFKKIHRKKKKKEKEKHSNQKKNILKKLTNINSKFSQNFQKQVLKRNRMMDLIEPENSFTSGVEVMFKRKKKYIGITIYRPLVSQRKKLISEQTFYEYIRRLTDPIGGTINSNLQKFLEKKPQKKNNPNLQDIFSVYYKTSPFTIEKENGEGEKNVKSNLGDGNNYFNNNGNNNNSNNEKNSQFEKNKIMIEKMNKVKPIRINNNQTTPNQNNNKEKIDYLQNRNNQKRFLIQKQEIVYVKPGKQEKAIMKIKLEPESGLFEIEIIFFISGKEIKKKIQTGDQVQTKKILTQYNYFMQQNGWKNGRN
ncbi:creb/atf bzip transcription factor [Anaeramoeba flamelloides]|uniref:Creb/atf bzip transcription factor n=1 Tax=Anaeramoeba flamelloides TaxID=1746091 RepID=A0ABQ8XI60_9EUKA|nr:creb/atf bzip transcription factor [Anaeramoeba flamelloides]